MQQQNFIDHAGTQTLSQRQRRIFDFLNQHHFGVLSTVTPDGNPHGAVVYFVTDPDFTVHILTKTGTRKYDNLIHNNHVLLTVFDVKMQATAQITGIATEYPGRHTIQHVADAIYAKQGELHKGLPPIMKLQADMFTTFTIEPVQIRMALYMKTRPGSYEDMFTSVESFDLVE